VPAGGGAPTNEDLAAAIVSYYKLIPNDLNAAWARLTPGFQNGKAGGRANFDAYWNTVASVSATDVVGRSPDTAYATLTYHFKSGRVVTDHTTFQLVRRDGTLKIAAES